jgi:hypothetical protein
MLLLNTLYYSSTIQFDLLYCMIKRLKTKYYPTELIQHKIRSLDTLSKLLRTYLHSIPTMSSTQIYFPARKAVHCDLALVPWPELNSIDYSHVCDIYI